jgi:hypothetical protein
MSKGDTDGAIGCSIGPYWVTSREHPACAISAGYAKNPVKWWTAWAAHMTNFGARQAIWAALDGKPGDLADHLRAGEASVDEMAFVADLIEGKIKSRRPRPGQPTRLLNDGIVQMLFQYQEQYPKWPKKKMAGEVADMAGVKERHVYNLLRALDAERREWHKRHARINVAFREEEARRRRKRESARK